MARRRPPPSKPETILTVEQKRRRIERLQNCIRDLDAFDPQKAQKRYGVPEVVELQAAIKDALSAAFGEGNRYSAAATLDNGPHFARSDWGGSANYDAQDARNARQYFAEGKQISIVLLKQAILTLEDEVADQEQLVPSSERQAPKIHARKVSCMGTMSPHSKQLHAFWRNSN